MPEEMDLEEDKEKDEDVDPEEEVTEDDMEDKDTTNAEDEDTEVTDENDQDEDEKPKHHKHKRKWYASAWFWVIVAAVAIITGGLIWFFGFYTPQKTTEKEETTAEKAVASDWSDVVSKTDTFANQVAAAKTVDDFTSLSKNADAVLEVVNRSEDRYKNQSTVQSSQYQVALENINAYLLALQAVLDKDYTKVTTNDFDSLKDAAAEAKDSADTFKDDTDYIKDAVGNDFFNTSIKVKTIYDAKIADDQAASEAAKQAQQKAAEKLAKEQEDVDAAVSGFMNEYIKGNKMEINKYMTDNFQNEFDYDKLSNDYYDPTSYRIIDTVKNTDSRYYVYGRLTEKQIGGTDQYAYDYNFTVVLDGGSWRVDVDSAPSR
jgi:cytoskeletal protein RodZ